MPVAEITKTGLDEMVEDAATKAADAAITKAMEDHSGDVDTRIEAIVSKAIGALGTGLADKLTGKHAGVTDVAEPVPSFLVGGGFWKSTKVASKDGTLHTKFCEGLEKLYKAEHKALGDQINTVYDADGGYLLNPTVASGLQESMYEVGQLAQDCYRLPLSGQSNSMTFPKVIEDDRSVDGSYNGIVTYWKNEAEAATSSKPVFGEDTIKLQKLISYVRVTDEMVEDAVFIDSFLRRNMPKSAAKKLDNAIMRGSGAGVPLGILNSPALVTADAVVGQGAGTLVYQNFTAMRKRMPGELMRGAKWYMNAECLDQLDNATLTDGTGTVAAYNPVGNAITGAFHGSLLGFPVVVTDVCSALGTAGDIMFGNLDEYMLLQKGNGDITSSIHVHFDTSETAYKFVQRINGQPTWHNVVTPQNGAITISPLIVLSSTRT